MPKLKVPRSTQIPDEIFDEYMAELSGAEFKVLCYIARRTFGFRKEADAISINQICEGITRRDGTRLDKGTGLSRSTAIEALKKLTAVDSLVLAEKRMVGESRENDVTVYCLNLEEDREVVRKSDYLVVGKSDHMWSENRTTEVVRKSDPQHTEDIQQTVDNSSAQQSIAENNQTATTPEPQNQNFLEPESPTLDPGRYQPSDEDGYVPPEPRKASRSRLPGKKPKDPDRWKMRTIPAREPNAAAETGQGSISNTPPASQHPPNESRPVSVAKTALPDEVETWNRIVTAAPRVELFDWERREGQYLDRCRRNVRFNPAAWERVCEKVQAILIANPERARWLGNFPWLIKADDNWWSVLAGHYDDMAIPVKARGGRGQKAAPSEVDQWAKDLAAKYSPGGTS